MLRYSDQVRDMIQLQLCAGVRPSQVASNLNVSRPFISKLRARFDLPTEALSLLPRRGQPRKVGSEAEEGLRDFLEEYPTARRDEACDFLRDEYGVDCSKWTVGRVIKRLNLTYKRVGIINIRRDEALRASFMARMAEYTAEQVICLDESAANERTSDRKYGWSLRGMPCRVRTPGRRSTRWSILPAITTDGILDYEVFHGSYTAERFNDFVTRVLDQMNAYPAPRSVLLLDNASIHHSAEFRLLCEAKGVRYEYLPPYSPDLNPIEMMFNELKAWMRRERELSYEYAEWFEGFIHLGMSLICSPATVRGYYREAGYGEPDEANDVY